MSVAKVKVISIIGMDKYLDEVINFCGKTESFQPDDALSFYSNTEKFTSLSVKDPYAESLNYIKELSSSLNKELYTVDTRNINLSKDDARKYINELELKFREKLDKREKLNSQIANYKKQISEMEHFRGFDFTLNKLFACEYINIRFGRIPKETYSRLEDYTDNPYVMFFVYTIDATHYWGMYCVPKDHAKEVDDVFSSLYFERMRLADASFTPEELISKLNSDLAKAEDDLQKLSEELEKIWEEETSECTRVYSKLKEYSTYYKIRSFGAQYRGKFIIVGWIPQKKEAEFREGLSRINGIDFEISRAEEASHHIPPTLLKNNFFTRPYEFFVNMYGSPNYKELDPTPFVTITYFMLFGMMFGDVGHGAVLFLLAIILAIKGNALGRILIPCSITSIMWGIVFGSVFGFEHALDPFYLKYLGLNEKPVEVMESSTTNYVLYCSAAVGVILLVLAILMSIVVSIKRKRFGKALFSSNGLSGLVFYTSLISGAVLQIAAKIPLFSNVKFLGFAIILPLIFMFFSEPLSEILEGHGIRRPEDGWVGYMMQNFFELFESILSYLTNTVSFLRIGAYVLVHAGMLLVVSTLANMFAPWSLGYTLIIVAGNIIVIGLEALLVGIQVLRLEFYEMFSRFYDGDGEPFTPVVVEKTKAKIPKRVKS